MESSSLYPASCPATAAPSSADPAAADPAATDRDAAGPATSSNTSLVGVRRPFDLPSDAPAPSSETLQCVFMLPCCGLSAAGEKADAQDKQFRCYSFPPQRQNGRVPLDHLSWSQKKARYFSSGIQGYPLQHQQQITGQVVGTQLVGPEAPLKVEKPSSALHAMEQHQPIAEHAPMFHQMPLLLPPWCDICRVDCTTAEALEKHRNGRRHRRTLQLLQKIEGQLDKSASNDCVEPEQVGTAVGSGATDLQSPTDAKSKKRKRSKHAKPEQARLCVLCDATCNSQAMFEAHLAGRKHLSKLKRFQGPNTVYGPVSAPTPPNQQSDLEASGAQPLCYGLIHYGQPLSPI